MKRRPYLHSRRVFQKVEVILHILKKKLRSDKIKVNESRTVFLRSNNASLGVLQSSCQEFDPLS